MGKLHQNFHCPNVATASAFALTATGTTYTDWFDVGQFEDLTCFVEATYTNQSGATIDVSVEVKNNRTGSAFTHTSFTQLTDTGTERKVLTSGFAGKIRFKVVAGGTFGSGPDESVALTIDFYGKGD